MEKTILNAVLNIRLVVRCGGNPSQSKIVIF